MWKRNGMNRDLFEYLCFSSLFPFHLLSLCGANLNQNTWLRSICYFRNFYIIIQAYMCFLKWKAFRLFNAQDYHLLGSRVDELASSLVVIHRVIWEIYVLVWQDMLDRLLKKCVMYVFVGRFMLLNSPLRWLLHLWFKHVCVPSATCLGLLLLLHKMSASVFQPLMENFDI